MAIVDLTKVGLYCEIHKRLQKSVIDNPLKPNAGVHAYPNLPNGVYKVYRIGGKKYQICCAYVPPVNHGRPNQLVCQGIYRDAVAAWNSLTGEQKQIYNVRAYGKHYTGYNAFIKEYFSIHFIK
jgi:hypothetical protein